MSCDSRLYLPPSTQLGDFADVLGILLGVPPKRLYGEGYWSCDVPHSLSWVPSPGTPTMLVLTGTANGHDVYGRWHWEGFSSPIPGARLFSCATNDARRKTLERIADVFGGILDFNDCDDRDVDFLGTLSNKAYRPDAQDDAGWIAWMEAKMNLAAMSYGCDW